MYVQCIYLDLLWAILIIKSVFAELIISGVLNPKYNALPYGVVIELFAVGNITDMSRYGIGVAHYLNFNSLGVKYTFDTFPLEDGSYVYFVNTREKNIKTKLETFLGKGIARIYESTRLCFELFGYEAIELYKDGQVIDTVGEMGVDGTRKWWHYKHGWLYRLSSASSPAVTWKQADWSKSGSRSLTIWTNNLANTLPFPAMTFSVQTGEYYATFFKTMVSIRLPPPPPLPKDR